MTKHRYISIAVSPENFALIEQAAKDSCRTPTNYCRALVLTAAIEHDKRRLPPQIALQR